MNVRIAIDARAALASLLLALAVGGCAEGVLVGDEISERGFKSQLPDRTSTSSNSTNTTVTEITTEDLGPLQLTVQSPPRGGVVDATEVRISGQVGNLSGGELLINGDPVTVDGQGNFSTQIAPVKGLNRIVTEVRRGQEYVEDRRSFVFGARANPSEKIEQAVTIHLGTIGMMRIGEVIAGVIRDLDLGQIIQDSGSGNDQFRVKEVNFDDVDINLTPGNGQIRISLAIRNLEIKFRGRFNILFIPVVVHGEVTANRVNIESDLVVRRTTEGSIGLDLRESQVDLNGFNFRIDNVPGWITGLFRDTAHREGEKLLRQTLEDFVVPALFSDELLTQQIEIMGKTLGIDLDIEQVVTDTSGLSLVLGSAVTVDKPVRTMGIVPTVIPPATRVGADAIKIATSVDFLNRLLTSAWSAGAFDIEMSTEDAGLSAFGVPILKAPLGEAGSQLQASDTLRFRLRPLIPPIASLDTANRPLRIDMGDAMLDIIGPQGTLVTVALDLSLGVGLTASSDPELTIEPELDIAIAADVAEMPLGQVNVPLMESQLESLAQLLPTLIADQTFNLSSGGQDVPFRLTDMVFGAQSGFWLDLFASFDVN